MDDLEVNEIPEEPATEPEEAALSEPEPAPEPEELTPESEEPAPESEEPAPEEPPGETEPEALSDENSIVSGETVQDLIGAIDNLNETITGAVTEQEPEQLPAEEGEGGGSGGGEEVVETSSVDLVPVVRVLERTTELLEQQNDVLITQHNDLLQIQADICFVFLAVCMLVGVVVGCFVARVFHDLWRA